MTEPPQCVTHQGGPDPENTQKSQLVAQTDPTKNKPEAAVPKPAYQPKIPFPQRLAKYRNDEHFGKFMEVLKQLSISMPLLDTLTQIPSYAKFLKDILSNKRSLSECKKVVLNHEVSAVLTRELPPKLGDLGKFVIPCNIGKAHIEREIGRAHV